MEVLWIRGSATVAEVVENLPQPPSAYSTVLTILRILENKGYVRHSKQGRAFVFHPLVSRRQARESALDHLLRKFFENSPELLLLSLVEGKKIDAAHLKRLHERILKPES